MLWNSRVPLVKVSPGSVLLAVCLLAAGAGAQCATGSAECDDSAKVLLVAADFAAADASIATSTTEAAVASPVVRAANIVPLIKPVAKLPQISHRDLQIWRGLAVMQHSAGVFDAWTTRKSLMRGGYERDPLMRPFAGNGSIYAMTQVTPVALDFLSRRMLRSNNSVVRRFWWLPQTVFTAGSVWCGVRNLHVAGAAR